jgi:hypothetical protein
MCVEADAVVECPIYRNRLFRIWYKTRVTHLKTASKPVLHSQRHETGHQRVCKRYAVDLDPDTHKRVWSVVIPHGTRVELSHKLTTFALFALRSRFLAADAAEDDDMAADEEATVSMTVTSQVGLPIVCHLIWGQIKWLLDEWNAGLCHCTPNQVVYYYYYYYYY